MIWKHLEDVPPEHNFMLKGGKGIRNVYELAFELAGMDDDTFIHHVNAEKNDFRNWILHIVKDEKLAARLSKAKGRKAMAKAVESRILEIEQERSHHLKVVEHGFKWGVREFGIGFVSGLFVALIFFKAMGMI